MINKTAVIIAATFTVCLSMAGCKKDSASSPNSIVGKWKLTAYIHNGMDVYGTGVGPCIIDDVTTFTSSNTVINDEGPTKCDPSDPQTITGTYSLSSDRSKLTLTVGGSSSVDDIKTLNATTLQVEQEDNSDLITFTRIP